ncbi:MAG: hypothetical protein ACREM8_07840 [Vulcanimicrobiaceae bacterium]
METPRDNNPTATSTVFSGTEPPLREEANLAQFLDSVRTMSRHQPVRRPQLVLPTLAAPRIQFSADGFFDALVPVLAGAVAFYGALVLFSTHYSVPLLTH